MNICKFFGDILDNLIFHLLRKFSDFDVGNVILFQIKVFGKYNKETTLARYFIKVTARLSFTRLRVIR